MHDFFLLSSFFTPLSGVHKLVNQEFSFPIMDFILLDTDIKKYLLKCILSMVLVHCKLDNHIVQNLIDSSESKYGKIYQNL